MSDEHHQMADILIIGGGLSGSMLAVQLLRRPGQRRIMIIETRSELGRGEAYSATELGHTLNGNAARMSVDPDNPADLTEWLTGYLAEGGWPESAEQPVPVAELFPPRGVFGLCARPASPETFMVRRLRMCAARRSMCSLTLPVSASRWRMAVCCVAAMPCWPPACTLLPECSGAGPVGCGGHAPARSAGEGADHRFRADHGRRGGVP